MSTTSTPPKHDLGSLKIDDRLRTTGKTGKRLGMFAALIGVLVIVGGLLAAFRSRKPMVEVAAARPAGDVRADALLNASGYITPRRRATVAAKVTGQVLAILDCSQPEAALTSAKTERDATAASLADLEVQLANAERELQRAEGLRS